jgi:hypothetical protein
MKKLLLISGNLSLRMAVGKDFEIVEERPSRNWQFNPASVDSVDAVLLDLHDEETTVRVLGEVFDTGYAGSVLVCAVSGEDWSHVAERSPKQIGVVELPVNGAALSAALNDLMPGELSGRTGSRRREDPPQPPSQREPSPSVQQAEASSVHVRQLTEALPRLRTVGSVCESLITDVVAATSSEACAVLVPDGEYWRVAAGLGVRHVEWRLAVQSDAWLLEEAVGQRHGIVVEDTDIARQRLSGTPLASWEQLMVVPVRETDVVVLVARHEQPYVDADIRRLAEAADEYRVGLADALALRDLARSLQEFADADLQDIAP